MMKSKLLNTLVLTTVSWASSISRMQIAGLGGALMGLFS